MSALNATILLTYNRKYVLISTNPQYKDIQQSDDDYVFMKIYVELQVDNVVKVTPK